ncbi:hypothetical protein FUA23_11265 [Neolewinella aurantiaca]|uniref:Uncharacterized protein n=1 Tax=Neolewinella aurantiaca TaxID=2602767 RepID=A0A5C7FSA6_9BACT|nr:hypothetical protein [Neolewinella aurantiaca]TXF89317.1 hypothetical protein FUA23_11265 [Neolewinella aurantiaca]
MEGDCSESLIVGGKERAVIVRRKGRRGEEGGNENGDGMSDKEGGNESEGLNEKEGINENERGKGTKMKGGT